MIEILFEHLVDGNFTRGLSKLSIYTEGQAKTKMAIGKIAKSYARLSKDVNVALNALIDEHCEKTEDGKRKPAPGTEGTYFIADENEAAWDKDLLHVAMKIDARQIALSEVEGVPLAPLELLALEPILNMQEPAPVKKKTKKK